MAAAAALSASTGAMNSVLSKLATLLEKETTSVTRAVRRQLVFFRDELTIMKGLIERLAHKDDQDPLVKGWMTQVREMTYDLEDCVDALMHHSAAPPRDSGSVLRRAARKMKTFIYRHPIPGQLQELEQRVRDASERRLRYKLDDEAASGRRDRPAAVDSRLTAIYADAVRLVGIDGPRDELVGLLMDGQQQLKVVPIVGFGGVGKTTLAMAVYGKIQEQFDCVGFMSVSQRPDIKRIFGDMLRQVCAREYLSTQHADEPQLIDALRGHLFNKRYFIVIDDVWSTSTWETIRIALPENDLGSRILVTTRIMSVAESCRYADSDHIFQMRPLADSEARVLFFRRIFGSEDSCPPQFAEVANDILENCGGLPLAIITMAGLLARRRYSIQEWEEIRDSVHSSLYKDASMEIMRTLNLSYIDLPFHLKTCLLYLSMFPKNYVIDRKRLVRRWIAEGFISGEHVDLEDVGDCYLNELIDRSLVQFVGIQYDGRVDACQVHDMILDLIISKSAEENFVIAYGNHEHKPGLQDKVRRLSLDCRYRCDTFKPSEITTLHVRSLTIIGSSGHMPVLENFHALRVLDLEIYGESLERHYLKNIGRLYLLKYLRINTTSVIQLPEEIGELKYLETLDLNGAPRCILPSSVVRLKRLVYLLVNNVNLPDGFGSMQKLQELSRFRIDSSISRNSLQELGNLSVLKALGLNWSIRDRDTDVKVYVSSLVSSLSKLSTSNLRSLYIESAYGCSLDFLLDFSPLFGYHLQEFQMKSNYCFPTAPMWLSSFAHLTVLRINIEAVTEEDLRVLGDLPKLLSLLLTVKSTPCKEGLVIRSNRFLCLKQFDLICWNCKMGMLMFEPHAMARLEKLWFGFSAQGEFAANSFHFGIHNLVSLEHVVVLIDCEDARVKDVKAAEGGIKNAVSIHPNHPRLELERLGESLMVTDEWEFSMHDDEEQDQNVGDNDVDQEIVVEGESAPTTGS